jgi:predicted transcriptional regulator
MIQGNQQDIIIREADRTAQRQWARYRGWTIEILATLENSGGLTVSQIADKLNHRKKAIREYCYRLFYSGCIEQVERWGWKITTQGKHLLFINDDHTNTTLTPHKHHSKTTPRQLTLTPYSNSEYSDPELALTNLLISHYEKTGQLFIYLEYENQLCELVGFPPDVVKSARMKLRQNGVAYLWFDKTEQAWQFRLYKPFLERLKHC